MSKFSEFLTSKKIDPRRVVSASKGLEKQTREDLALIAKKAAIKAGKAEKNAEIQKAKPHSGRPVTNAAIEKATKGAVISGPTKTRIVRAVNAILAAKKQTAVTIRDMF